MWQQPDPHRRQEGRRGYLEMKQLGNACFSSAMPASIIIAIAGLASHILFVLFMRRIAAFIGRMDLVARARNILKG